MFLLFYLVRYVVVLRGHIYNKGHLGGGGGLKIETFLGPKKSKPFLK
jgi:hypothetical protein